ANLEAREALRANRQAQTVQNLLVDVFLNADPYLAKRGETKALDLLNAARERVAYELAEQPNAAAPLLRAIGETYVALGERANAEKALRQAQRVAGGTHDGALIDAMVRARLAHYAAVFDRTESATTDLDAAIGDLRKLGTPAQRDLATALSLR